MSQSAAVDHIAFAVTPKAMSHTNAETKKAIGNGMSIG
jgi:hypothetical protein